jgi:hypothetical protein
VPGGGVPIPGRLTNEAISRRPPASNCCEYWTSCSAGLENDSTIVGLLAPRLAFRVARECQGLDRLVGAGGRRFMITRDWVVAAPEESRAANIFVKGGPVLSTLPPNERHWNLTHGTYAYRYAH